MRARTRPALAATATAAAVVLLTACSGGAQQAGTGSTSNAGSTAGSLAPSGTATGVPDSTSTASSTGSTGTRPGTAAPGSEKSGTKNSAGTRSSSSGAAGNSAGGTTNGTWGGSAGGSSGGGNQLPVVPNPTGNSRPTQIAATPGTGCVPTRVEVPSVGISEPIVAMGTNSQGQIYPPARTTMWYDKSPQPGTNGVAVVAGHVTYDGPDDFYELDRVRDGASVTVRCSNGRVLAWRVSAKQSVLKTKLQTDQRVWGGSSTPVVALITCDRASRVVSGHHLNNYVVWVRPA